MCGSKSLCASAHTRNGHQGSTSLGKTDTATVRPMLPEIHSMHTMVLDTAACCKVVLQLLHKPEISQGETQTMCSGDFNTLSPCIDRLTPEAEAWFTLKASRVATLQLYVQVGGGAVLCLATHTCKYHIRHTHWNQIGQNARRIPCETGPTSSIGAKVKFAFNRPSICTDYTTQ